MSSAISLKGRFAFDSSVLVEIFSNSELAKFVYSHIRSGELTVFASRVNLAEATYFICRQVGHERARSAAKDLLDSGCVLLEDGPEIHEVATEMKCDRGVSLADCYTFAEAKIAGAKPVFAREGSELAREARKRPFETAPIFLS